MHKTYSHNKNKPMSCTAELAGPSESDNECMNHKVLFNLTGGSVRRQKRCDQGEKEYWGL